MPQANLQDGSSGRRLVIGMLVGATILSIIAVIYTHYHPFVDPATVPATTQNAE